MCLVDFSTRLGKVMYVGVAVMMIKNRCGVLNMTVLGLKLGTL